MRALPAGWYVLLYHDVSWEESAFVRHIGGTCTPDVFRDHVRACSQWGELVSVSDGMQRLSAAAIDRPLFSFWFDDGFAGVRKYAAPALQEFGIAGGTSVCSRFIDRTEMFWRLKLSYLHSLDAGRVLRSRLRPFGFTGQAQVRDFTLDHFGADVLGVINSLFDEAVSSAVQKDAFRLFDTRDGLLELVKHGWTLANHSAAHYPIGPTHVLDTMIDQFEECEALIKDVTGRGSACWVLPFDRNVEPGAIARLHEHLDGKPLALVRNRINLPGQSTRELFRIAAPVTKRDGLQAVLHQRTYNSPR